MYRFWSFPLLIKKTPKSFQMALRESEFMMLCCICVCGFHIQSVQEFKLLSEIQYQGLPQESVLTSLIEKKGILKSCSWCCDVCGHGSCNDWTR